MNSIYYEHYSHAIDYISEHLHQHIVARFSFDNSPFYVHSCSPAVASEELLAAVLCGNAMFKPPTHLKNQKLIVLIVLLVFLVALVQPALQLFWKYKPLSIADTAHWRLSAPRHDFQPRPEHCDMLMQQPRPYAHRFCHRRKDAALLAGDFRCANGKLAMFSQYKQDFVMYHNHFRHLKRRGNYLDIATNDPLFISNSYFFDRCLGWGGICVEANSRYHERINRFRSCSLLPTCVGAEDGEKVSFILHGGLGGIVETNKNLNTWFKGGGRERKVNLRCTTVGKILKRYPAPRVIDYMSLDVEGHELPVLKGIDWSTTRINVVNIEVSSDTKPAIREFMLKMHYTELERLQNRVSTGKFMRGEAVFLAPGVVFGKPV